MLRRAVLFGPLLAAPQQGAHTDGWQLNEFAAAYNAYVMKLREGIVDLKLWRAVVHAWNKLENL